MVTPKQYRIELYHEVTLALLGTETYDQIAARFGISNRTVWEVAKRNNIKKKRGPRPKKVV